MKKERLPGMIKRSYMLSSFWDSLFRTKRLEYSLTIILSMRGEFRKEKGMAWGKSSFQMRLIMKDSSKMTFLMVLASTRCRMELFTKECSTMG